MKAIAIGEPRSTVMTMNVKDMLYEPNDQSMDQLLLNHVDLRRMEAAAESFTLV